MTNKQKLYEYAVLLHTEDKDGNWKTEIVVPLDRGLADSDSSMAFKVTRMIPEAHTSNPENLEIIVRPF